MDFRSWGVVLAVPFLVTTMVNVAAAVVGGKHPTWMKRAPLVAVTVVLGGVAAILVPGLSQGVREALAYPIAAGLALLPNLVWLAVTGTLRLRWRVAGAVAFAAIGAFVGLTALLSVVCAVSGNCP